MKIAHHIGLILFLFLLYSCKQKDVEPAYYVYATAGSESFKFEGNTYLASSSGSYKSTFIMAAYPNANSELTFTTTRPLTGSSATLIISYASFSSGIGKYYYGSSGLCTISKFDGNAVEGTFSFDAFSTTGNEKINVKDGRFRLKYT